MTKTFLAGLLSLSLIATTAPTSPAHANEEFGKFLAGLAALGIVATVVKSNRKSKIVTREVLPPLQPQPRHYRKPVKIAPSHCLRQQWTHRGERQVYGAKCLQKNVRTALPQSCLRQAKIKTGPRFFYKPRCLQEHGWRI